MKQNRWKVSVICLVVPLLIFLVWRSEGDTLSTPHPVASTMETPAPAEGHLHFHPEECAACPERQSRSRMRELEKITNPVLVSESEKRNRHEPEWDMEEIQQRVNDCSELLREAARAGVLNPDASYLGGCRGKNALWEVETVEELQLLIATGADVNVRSEFGDTPLHFKVFMGDPEMVKALLDAGANPHLEVGGDTPLEELKMITSIDLEIFSEFLVDVERKAGEWGFPREEYLRRFPSEKHTLDHTIKEIEASARIGGYLRQAMNQEESGG